MAHLTGQERARYVKRMFARISRRYDLLNTVMTGGRHYAWRKRATRMAVEGLSGPALDIATGTGDFAFDLARRPEVTGVVGLDFTRDMLTLAKGKANRQKLSNLTTFAAGDAHALQIATLRPGGHWYTELPRPPDGRRPLGHQHPERRRRRK